MALKANISLKNLPPYMRVVLACLPSALIIVLVVFLLLVPKNKEIRALGAKISAQENEIAKNQAKAAKLPELTLENEKLRARLNELKQQLPEEKEVSTLLKQVSDLCIRAGLRIALWKPEQRRTHSSGIVYEIPVSVELSGGYHSLGFFFSSLTALERIVNISNIKLSDPKPDRASAVMKISFTATTFSAIPEEEIGKKGEEDKDKKK